MGAFLFFTFAICYLVGIISIAITNSSYLGSK